MDSTRPSKLRREGEGAIAWLAFVVIAVVAVAAIITGAIRHGVEQAQPAAASSGAAGQPSPAPPPLPKPGIAPTGALLDMNA